MGEMIYGVDTSKKITPVKVRDAIIRCFVEAECDIRGAPWKDLNMSKKEYLDAKHVEAREMVRQFLEKEEGGFHDPTRKSLKKVIDNLKKYASRLGRAEVAEKHHAQIMDLILSMEE